MNPLLNKPSSDFNAVRDGRTSLPLYIDVDLSSARSIGANSALVLSIAGNSFFSDADTTSGGNATVHFQDTSLGISSAPFFVSPGFIANVGFTQLLIENTVQAGKRLRIFYGVDIDFQAGVTASTQTTIGNTLASKIPVAESGMEYGGAFKSIATLAANTPEVVFTPAANANGAIIHALQFTSVSGGGFPDVVFIAKNAAPANVTDGDVIVSMDNIFNVGANNYCGGSLKNPIRIPAGKGLYAISAVAEFAGYSIRSALYTLL